MAHEILLKGTQEPQDNMVIKASISSTLNVISSSRFWNGNQNQNWGNNDQQKRGPYQICGFRQPHGSQL